VKLVHLFGFITKKFVTMHGHMNVKFFFFYCLILEGGTGTVHLNVDRQQLTSQKSEELKHTAEKIWNLAKTGISR